MKKYYNKISLWSRLINFLFVFTDDKKNSSTVENTKNYIKKLSNKNKNYDLPKEMGLKLEEGFEKKVYSYNGRLTGAKKRKILYIHGGSFIEEANSYQIRFAKKVAKQTDSALIFPVYSLVPDGNWEVMYSFINDIYQKISDSSEEIILLGDSAGGGFVLSYAMYLRDQGGVQPNHIIMISPWVDLSMSNPAIIKDAKKDYMCGVDGTRYCGELWANELDIKDPLVSPLYGSFDNLGVLTILTGGKEILSTECRDFSKKLDQLQIDHNFIEYKGQGHVFVAFPTKEGNLAINDICGIINEC